MSVAAFGRRVSWAEAGRAFVKVGAEAVDNRWSDVLAEFDAAAVEVTSDAQSILAAPSLCDQYSINRSVLAASFGATSRPATMRVTPPNLSVAAGCSAVMSLPADMPEPWLLPGLPHGLTERHFVVASRVLLTGRVPVAA
ncbi:hypothetical protein [uncultured Jatrophihabitans sp.]|uniref:hypothetical protein n=1 Tax=uncultured Jatrophihabitans sp. TaxID=1610747 RepID=UPI0035C9C9BF